MTFSSEAKSLIEQKQFEQLETRWLAQVQADPSDVEDFLTTAKALRRAEERSRADALLGLLADALKEKGLWPQRLKALKELSRLSKPGKGLQRELEETIKHVFSASPSFARVMQHVKLSENEPNLIEKVEKIENALGYDEGSCYFMPGRGAGVVRDLNLDLGICRLDFERDKRVAVPLGAAQKFLVPLPPGHPLRRKIEDPERLKAEAAASPSEIFAAILRSFGKAMTASEVKDTLIGIVADTKWSSWWSNARKHPQIVVSGTGARASYAWNATSEAAEGSIRRDFDQAASRNRLELAKKHSSRNQELADHFASTLARQASTLSRSDPGLAWEILTTLEKLPGKYTSEIDPQSLLLGAMASRVIEAVPDRNLRETALKNVRDKHPDWPKVFGEIFFLDDDLRILTMVIDSLEKGHSDVRDRLIDETLRYPRRHPRAFYWLTKRLADGGEPQDKANYALLFQLLDSLSFDEFAALRPRLKEFFDKGSLAVQIINRSDNAEHARKVLETIDRFGMLEEYRREILKSAALMKHPEIREPQTEPFYATAESLEMKRQELDQLRRVDIPENSRALQAAREMGDLRENFEYKAARQRAEYLSARVGELQNEISRVRVLDPALIDITVVRIGTRVSLQNGDEKRDVTILGAWESSPEHGIYSSQADVAKALLGRSKGEIVSFMGNDYEIAGIRRWK